MHANTVLTVEQMRDAEAAATEAGMSEWDLMQRAGHGAAEWVWRMAAGRPVTVLCGPGNNGGDGYVIAGWLRGRGLDVRVVAPVEPKTETAATARSRYRGTVSSSLEGVPAPVLVDALFGYGLSRALDGDFSRVLEEAGASHSFKIAIDIPSGVESDTGRLLGKVPRFDLTLALGAWKQAHFLMPGLERMGARRLVPIGLEETDAGARLSQHPRLRVPAADSHKYSRGLVAVVAGAMPGAPILSSEAAMRSGAGYVKLLSDHSHPDAPADLVIEDGDLGDALEDERISALLIGPGLGRSETARERLAAVLETRCPAVLDADALHLLDWDLIEGVDRSRLIVTPHEGELARLCDAFDVEKEGKLARARALHDATGLTVLAKGPDTVLVGEEGRTCFLPQGSSWLSVAGTGDVLAGVVAARLAVTGTPMEACEEAVWLHQEAARRAAPAFTASDLARAVRPALAEFL